MRAIKENDFEEIQSWWTKREKTPISREYFSDSGFIEEGKAAVFLYKTNSAICYLESLISNPDAENTDEAIDQVIQAGIKQAKVDGYKLILASSNRDYVIKRVSKLGFKDFEGYSQLVLKL